MSAVNAYPSSNVTRSLSPALWQMLPARLALFTLFQALFALGFALAGGGGGTTVGAAWDASAPWWPFTVTFTNLICFALLSRIFQSEGGRYWDMFRIDRAHLKGDLLVLLVILLISGPVSYLPNILMGTWLFGDSLTPANMMFRHLPTWAAYASLVLFPVTQGLVELPYYFRYLMPRLSQQTGKPWLALALSASFLALQHIAVPLLFDGRFIAWRLVMFLPFAFMLGLVLKWRPRMLPYLAIFHVLIDFASALFLLSA